MATSRPHAAELIAAGRVLVGGAVADKPARMVAAGEPLEVTGGPPRYVSRAGEKLAAALERFAVPVAGRRALDIGASTGGFTDCLVQAGATRVVAVDVGHHQIHERVAADPRVLSLEGTDGRTVTLDTVEGIPVDVVTADVSFISVTRLAVVLTGPAVARGADLVLLVKPQFEAGRAEVSRGRGVVRDATVHRRVLHDVAGALRGAGALPLDVMPSPLTGRSGNIEFLLRATVPPTGKAPREAAPGSLGAVDGPMLLPTGSSPGPAPGTGAAFAARVDAAVAEAHAVHGSPA